MWQSLTLIGNIGNSPEVEYLPSGTAKTTLSLATNRTYQDSHGPRVRETTWFQVTCLGKLAETVAMYAEKGQLILVQGRLQPDYRTGGPRIWEKKDGTKAASFEVLAHEVRFLLVGDRSSPPEARIPF